MRTGIRSGSTLRSLDRKSHRDGAVQYVDVAVVLSVTWMYARRILMSRDPEIRMIILINRRVSSAQAIIPGRPPPGDCCFESCSSLRLVRIRVVNALRRSAFHGP